MQCRLNHPHVAKVIGALESNGNTYVAVEVASGGDLCDYLMSHPRLDEQEARRLFQQLIAAVDHCHHRRIAHRDLKLDNLLLTKDLDLKITDFGLAALMIEGETFTEA